VNWLARSRTLRTPSVAGEAGVVAHVLEHERLPRDEHPPGDAGAGGDALADQRLRSLACDRLEHELVVLLVQQEDRGSPGREDRARDLDDGLQEGTMLLLGAQDAGGHRRAQVVVLTHCPPPTFPAVR
jgi:hypothetical protein